MVGPFGSYPCRLIKSRYKVIILVCYYYYYYMDNDNMFFAPPTCMVRIFYAHELTDFGWGSSGGSAAKKNVQQPLIRHRLQKQRSDPFPAGGGSIETRRNPGNWTLKGRGA